MIALLCTIFYCLKERSIRTGPVSGEQFSRSQSNFEFEKSGWNPNFSWSYSGKPEGKPLEFRTIQMRTIKSARSTNSIPRCSRRRIAVPRLTFRLQKFLEVTAKVSRRSDLWKSFTHDISIQLYLRRMT